jgi:hypothetical protein
MGVTYNLINVDKREVITFKNMNTGTKEKEITGTIIASAIVSFYMIKNIGDRISVVPDGVQEIILFGKTYLGKEISLFREVTEEVVTELISNEIFINKGKIWIDQDENLFYWDLNNIWDPKLNEGPAKDVGKANQT